uniref:Uncharacterized protein n=1 Tax=Steinernema glaseri TaxID=37863 RepID=A0A1I8AF96_9BILA
MTSLHPRFPRPSPSLPGRRNLASCTWHPQEPGSNSMLFQWEWPGGSRFLVFRPLKQAVGRVIVVEIHTLRIKSSFKDLYSIRRRRRSQQDNTIVESIKAGVHMAVKVVSFVCMVDTGGLLWTSKTFGKLACENAEDSLREARTCRCDHNPERSLRHRIWLLKPCKSDWQKSEFGTSKDLSVLAYSQWLWF